MFTGLVEEVGSVTAIIPRGGSVALHVDLGIAAEGVQLGDSVAIDGVCLTATALSGQVATFDAVPETISRTALGTWKVGTRVNLERALRVGDRLGGHFVQGHVDGIGRILEKRPQGGQVLLRVEVPPELTAMMIVKGSVAVSGLSLTIVDLTRTSFSVALVPFTLSKTTLADKDPGALVNIEVDMLGKWVCKLLGQIAEGGRLTAEDLRRAGF